MTVVLWHIEISHYNEKVRWALDHKGIPYELRAPMPGMHRLTALRLTRGKHDRLPVLGLDGRRIGDSTAIIAALEDYKPEPALYPADPAERGRALELEDYFDEELAPRVRRVFWHYTLADPEAALANGSAFQRGLLLRTAPIAGRTGGAAGRGLGGPDQRPPSRRAGGRLRLRRSYDPSVALDSQRARLILSMVRSVPEGFVTTYGDLSPGAPRFAGAVLAHTDDRVPWHRVVRADGSLAQGSRQRTLLKAEGIPFRGRRVDMREAQLPPEALDSISAR